MGKTHN